MPDQFTCSECGGIIPPDARQRLCAQCLLKLGPKAGKSKATPETCYDGQWALTVLGHVFARLREEYRAAGNQALFEALKGGLPGAEREEAPREAAKAPGMTDTALRMAAHRLRRRYAQLLRQEIADGLDSPQDDPDI